MPAMVAVVAAAAALLTIMLLPITDLDFPLHELAETAELAVPATGLAVAVAAALVDTP